MVDTQPDPAAMYKRIDRRIRAVFKKRNMVDCPFVQDLEDQIDEMRRSQGTSLELSVESSYHRLLARGVAQYYGLKMTSNGDDESEAVTVVISVKDSDEQSRPSPMRLLAYIDGLGAVQHFVSQQSTEKQDPPRRRSRKKKSGADLSIRLSSLKVNAT